jgi:hypothetical protein
VLCSSVGCSLAHWKDIRPWRPNFGSEGKPSAEWLRQNSECSFYFLFHRTEFRLFSLPRRIQNLIPRFPSIFVPQNGILSCFLSRGRVRNGILRVFCSAEQPEFRLKYPFVPAIPSSVELYFCRKFPTLVLSPPDILLESCGLLLEWLLIFYPMKLSNSF